MTDEWIRTAFYINCILCLAPNYEWIIMFFELVRIRGKVDIAYIKALYQHSPGGNEENHRNLSQDSVPAKT
jgi:hypothetical protein